jgi:hypothetical protein
MRSPIAPRKRSCDESASRARSGRSDSAGLVESPWLDLETVAPPTAVSTADVDRSAPLEISR